VDGRSLDYSKMNERKEMRNRISSLILIWQRLWLIKDHVIWHTSGSAWYFKEGFDRSPMFNGRIRSLGPRYCPSIEDKINRFADKERHQLSNRRDGKPVRFMSMVFTSLPADIQFKAMKSIAGFERISACRVMRSNTITFRQRNWDIP
jgi:tRNA uridine 5-carboxymethylaminomethyl modification enzyme